MTKEKCGDCELLKKQLAEQKSIISAFSSTRHNELTHLIKTDEHNKRLWSHVLAGREMQRYLNYIIKKSQVLIDLDLEDLVEAAKYVRNTYRESKIFINNKEN
jgi:hypothetical protein